jgi:hypothetical protein
MVDVASHCRDRECEGERKRRRSNQPELGHDFLLFGFSPESTEGGIRLFQKIPHMSERSTAKSSKILTEAQSKSRWPSSFNPESSDKNPVAP